MKLVKKNTCNSVSQLAGKRLDLERNIALLLDSIFSDAQDYWIQIQLVWSLVHFAKMSLCNHDLCNLRHRCHLVIVFVITRQLSCLSGKDVHQSSFNTFTEYC